MTEFTSRRRSSSRCSRKLICPWRQALGFARSAILDLRRLRSQPISLFGVLFAVILLSRGFSAVLGRKDRLHSFGIIAGPQESSVELVECRFSVFERATGSRRKIAVPKGTASSCKIYFAFPRRLEFVSRIAKIRHQLSDLARHLRHSSRPEKDQGDNADQDQLLSSDRFENE